MDSSDFGIAHVTVTLNGTDDLGDRSDMTATTNANGVYSFGGLRPGTYDMMTKPSLGLLRIQEHCWKPGRNGEHQLVHKYPGPRASQRG